MTNERSTGRESSRDEENDTQIKEISIENTNKNTPNIIAKIDDSEEEADEPPPPGTTEVWLG